MSERSRFADRDRAEKSDQLYEATEYSRRCLCDDIAELTFDNIKLNATIKKSKEDFANLQNRLMCSLLLMLGNDDDVDRIIEKADELTRAFKDERVSTLQCENAKLRELIGKIEQYEQYGCMNCPHADGWSVYDACGYEHIVNMCRHQHDSWERIESDARKWMQENGTPNGVMHFIERCRALAGDAE